MSPTARPTVPGAPRQVQVWDPLVRIGHWLLVAGVIVAYLSGEEEGDSTSQLHAWAGYMVGGIVALRVLWGFVGTRYARFTQFVRGPAAALTYLRDLLTGGARRYIGHTPAGGLMIVLLLLSLAGTVGTGMIARGDIVLGPAAQAALPRFAHAAALVVAPAYADEDEADGNGENGEGPFADLHGALANITVALAVLHVLGVAASSLAHRENLVRAMVTGRKRAGD